ncbi:YjcZ family sporulation protein [Priestia aryabhattai]|uniref:YjcZ family sporulation protein n=1 Tax=Priestia sp. FSL R5-0597 TaxID=2921580 RepID=UPI000532F7B3|nr:MULTISPECIES: YjcZ family sporulation protein [Priestia]MCA1050804.1 YjcZ family sporulation protein [Priestia aryabhattai]MCM2975395.1 YjcZ family sporulation protein [Priestia aryabhattai]MEB4868531.1 YjcZ family sporulation protein [Priestia megaterium]MED3957692.1 YjcZ family sporulation protein [Priestia aryabhattai]MED4005512.1 YjcZ family sporulation protein [Priestia aryabhattai]
MHNNVNAPFSSHENVPFSPAMAHHAYTAPAYDHMIPHCGYTMPDYGYMECGYSVPCHRGNGFAIIIVLFILLIIIGACGFGFHHDDC